jgi:hypothetical protein
MRSEEEVRKRVEELKAELDGMEKDPYRDMFVVCMRIAERDALRWVLGEEIEHPRGKEAYTKRLPWWMYDPRVRMP